MLDLCRQTVCPYGWISLSFYSVRYTHVISIKSVQMKLTKHIIMFLPIFATSEIIFFPLCYITMLILKCQVGKTKVFLRAGQMAELDARRNEVLGQSASKIQRKVRSYRARKHYILLQKSAIQIQAICRGKYVYIVFVLFNCNRVANIGFRFWAFQFTYLLPVRSEFAYLSFWRDVPKNIPLHLVGAHFCNYQGMYLRKKVLQGQIEISDFQRGHIFVHR